MLYQKIDIIDIFKPPKSYNFVAQSFGHCIRILTTLYFNIRTFDNVKITLPNGYFLNGYLYYGSQMLYIDGRFIEDYWRQVVRRYCPCGRDLLVEHNSHARNFMRISYKPYPSFAVAFALLHYYNYYSRNYCHVSPYFKTHYNEMPCCNPIPMTITTELKSYKVYVPCGRCYFCQSAKRASFALRCKSQLELYKNFGSSYFVTLTYDDNHLFSFKSRNVIKNYLSAEAMKLEKDRKYDIFLLEKKKFSLFIRRLRRVLRDRCNIPYFKFIASGEYGTLHNRPHYHFLFFCPNFIRQDYFSALISTIWKSGTNEVQEMVDANINYVGKHSVKSDLGCQYQQQFAPAFMLYSISGGSVGCHLKHSNFYWNIYNSGQKFIKFGKYKYYFPRYLSKAFHPYNLSEVELQTLEKSTGEMFDRHMFLYDNCTNEPIFIKSRLLYADYQKRLRYEKMRVLKKVKKRRYLV